MGDIEMQQRIYISMLDSCTGKHGEQNGTMQIEWESWNSL